MLYIDAYSILFCSKIAIKKKEKEKKNRSYNVKWNEWSKKNLLAICKRTSSLHSVISVLWLSPRISLTFLLLHAAKKRSFPLKISSVNAAKSAGECEFGHIYWKHP